MFSKLFRKEFQLGDVVRVKKLPDSPTMIVVDNTSSLRCMYFNTATGLFNYAALNADLLELVKRKEDGNTDV